METDLSTPVNRCGYYGSTNYRRAVEHNAKGAMRYAERLVCSGCTCEFTDMNEWREGVLPGSEQRAPKGQCKLSSLLLPESARLGCRK